MGNSLLAVREINHKYIVVGGNGSNQYVQTVQNGPFAKLSLDEIASQLDRGITRSLKSYRFYERSIK